MLLNRRTFTALAAAGTATALLLSDQARAAGRTAFKAIAFDGFPVIDPRPVFARVEEMFSGQGSGAERLLADAAV